MTSYEAKNIIGDKCARCTINGSDYEKKFYPQNLVTRYECLTCDDNVSIIFERVGPVTSFVVKLPFKCVTNTSKDSG